MAKLVFLVFPYGFLCFSKKTRECEFYYFQQKLNFFPLCKKNHIKLNCNCDNNLGVSSIFLLLTFLNTIFDDYNQFNAYLMANISFFSLFLYLPQCIRTVWPELSEACVCLCIIGLSSMLTSVEEITFIWWFQSDNYIESFTVSHLHSFSTPSKSQQN